METESIPPDASRRPCPHKCGATRIEWLVGGKTGRRVEHPQNLACASCQMWRDWPALRSHLTDGRE
ncbi:MAG TPA: hypothetical protein VMK12_25835 [Anaeromyxobacteraceae bacterium]|nr:hypothetical protein [Anaeromyxobacteraceae bacterium]